jgi:glycosyltransferase involved in cell wall biosynthesis
MKVTVVVRTCNRPELFKEALTSIHLQTHKDWEVIIFDDGASDLNFSIYKKFKSQYNDKRVLYVTLNEAWGLYKSSWLMAVDLAMGDIIVRLDDDDLLAEDALEFLSNTYEKNPELDFSYGSALTFSDNGIGDVESAKVVPHVFVVFHGQVSKAIKDSFVVRFDRKFGLEERSNNGPCPSVARDILKSLL